MALRRFFKFFIFLFIQAGKKCLRMPCWHSSHRPAQASLSFGNTGSRFKHSVHACFSNLQASTAPCGRIWQFWHRLKHWVWNKYNKYSYLTNKVDITASTLVIKWSTETINHCLSPKVYSFRTRHIYYVKVSLESQELKVCIFISLKWKKVKAVSRVHEDTQKILKSQWSGIPIFLFLLKWSYTTIAHMTVVRNWGWEVGLLT